MSTRLDVENPFYDNDASASIFGWEFQVDSAIFLFLKYLKEVSFIKVESKYQDIELHMNDNSCIYAQAKSIQDGSNTNNKKKLEDAIISLVKTPVDYTKNDRLLYVSNYSVPIKEKNIFNNKIVALKNASDEKIEFKNIVDDIINKLNDKIQTDNKISSIQKRKLNFLKERLQKMNIEDFLICSIFPYLTTEQPIDKYEVIYTLILKKITNEFNIITSNATSYADKILKNWQRSFLSSATLPDNDKFKDKLMTKLELMFQVIAIISEAEPSDLKDILSFELNDDIENQYSLYYSKKSFYHDRFQFINDLYDECKNFKPKDIKTKKKEFINCKWENYKNEYKEFMEYNDEHAQEYLIKRDLLRLLTNSCNIKKIIDGVQNDN